MKTPVDRLTLRAYALLSDEPIDEFLEQYVYQLLCLLEGRPPPFDPRLENIEYCPFCLQKFSNSFSYHLRRYCRGVNPRRVEKLMKNPAMAELLLPDLKRFKW